MYELSLIETRIIGVLFEKERTTPEQYPLSLNALVNACNQKSSREPVMALSETEVQEAVDGLIAQNLLLEVVVGSRVKKYKQRFGNTEFSALQLNRKEQAIICLLFLRGPQTAGELRTRSSRLATFSGLEDVEASLQTLQQRDTPCIERLEREPGKRESRYRHLFSVYAPGSASAEDLAMPTQTETLAVHSENGRSNAELEARVTELEQELSSMRNDIEEIKAIWQSLND